MQWEINREKEISFDLTYIIVREIDRHEGNNYSRIIVQGKYFENTKSNYSQYIGHVNKLM